MSLDDADMVARIMQDHENGRLNDVTVYALLARVRADAVIREREREAVRLEDLARDAQRRGALDVAEALAAAAERLTMRGPVPADVSDA